MKTPILRALELKNFRSVRHARIDFDNPTFLIGRNGSGKSNIVDSLALLSDAMTSPLEVAIARHGGVAEAWHRHALQRPSPRMGIAVELGAIDAGIDTARYAFELESTPDRGFYVVREQCVVNGHDSESRFERVGDRILGTDSLSTYSPASNALAFPVVGGSRPFQPALRFLSEMAVYGIHPTTLRKSQAEDDGIRLRRDGGNLASVLQRLRAVFPGRWNTLVKLLDYVVPTTADVRSVRLGGGLDLEFTQRWTDSDTQVFPATSMSDGTLRVVALMTAVLQERTPPVLVIEEPEATMHSRALAAVLEILEIAAKVAQVVVTTHSTEILDVKWMQSRHIRVVEWSEGLTRVHGVSDETRSVLKDHMMGAGELIRTNFVDSERIDSSVPESLFVGS